MFYQNDEIEDSQEEDTHHPISNPPNQITYQNHAEILLKEKNYIIAFPKLHFDYNSKSHREKVQTQESLVDKNRKAHSFGNFNKYLTGIRIKTDDENVT